MKAQTRPNNNVLCNQGLQYIVHMQGFMQDFILRGRISGGTPVRCNAFNFFSKPCQNFKSGVDSREEAQVRRGNLKLGGEIPFAQGPYETLTCIYSTLCTAMLPAT